MKTEKIQKVLARSGYASRRTVEKWIEQGRIQVKGKIAKLGDRVSPADKIYLDGKLCQLQAGDIETRILLYHKPVGLVCTRHDPEGRETVFQQLPPIRNGRWIAVGRLDVNTSGLLLFTNNGDLAHRLMHPAQQVEREYMVRVHGPVSPELVKRLTLGVTLEDGHARFEDVVAAEGDGTNRWFYVVVVGGRNRVVRRLWESQGLKVNRLKRVRFGPIFLPKSLRQGSWLELANEQKQLLLNIIQKAAQI